MKGWLSNSQTFNLVQHKVAEVSQGWLQDDNFGLYVGNGDIKLAQRYKELSGKATFLLVSTSTELLSQQCAKYIVMLKNVHFF